jgi:hypothetical protein
MNLKFFFQIFVETFNIHKQLLGEFTNGELVNNPLGRGIFYNTNHKLLGSLGDDSPWLYRSQLPSGEYTRVSFTEMWMNRNICQKIENSF